MRRLAFNSLDLSLSSYFAAGASALIYLLAARSLGPAIFGPLTGAIGIAVVLAAFADFGMNGWTIRALARDPTSVEVFNRTLTAKVAVATLVAVAWIMASLSPLVDSSLKLPAVILAGYVLCQIVAGTLTVPFRASQNMTV